MSRTRRVAFSLLTVLAGAVVFLGLAEVVLRLRADPNRFFPREPGLVQIFELAPGIAPGISGPTRFTTNSIGCRGPEPAGEKRRLLTVGGSTTACSYLDDQEEWSALVMRYVNEARGERLLWVNNAGIDGRDTAHHAVLVERFLPRLPRLDWVLLYTGLNDASHWLQGSESALTLGPDDEESADVVARAFKSGDLVPPGSPWYKHLLVYQATQRLKLARRSQRALQLAEVGGIVQDDEGRWIQEARRHRLEKGTIPLTPEQRAVLPRVLDIYVRRLEKIARLARARGAEPIYVTQAVRLAGASEDERKLIWSGRQKDGTFLDDAGGQSLVAAFNERMREVSTRLGIHCIDLAARLDAVPGLTYDGVHFNEAGARAAARVIADELLARELKDAAEK